MLHIKYITLLNYIRMGNKFLVIFSVVILDHYLQGFDKSLQVLYTALQSLVQKPRKIS